MKKLTVIALALICVLGVCGCGQDQSLQQPQDAQLLLPEGNIVSVEISSLPEGFNYSFGGEDAETIADYLSSLHLGSDFEENPNEYTGMTYVISLKYDSDEVLTVYHFGNMFIRSEDAPWYKMTYDEASRFDTLLDELDK